MEIKDACFIISNSDISKCPTDGKSEYAFIGRSNVGKSSLINTLTNRKNLALTSAQPGKTLLINHFLINNEWYLVDLPGYGYARRGKEERERLSEIIHNYVLNRKELICLFLLIDSRHDPKKIDLDFILFLGENGIPFSIIFTKIDKLGKNKLREQIDGYKNALLENWEELPTIFLSSSLQKTGREEILSYIEDINNAL